MHWLDTLHEIHALKLELARLDPHGAMPLTLPAGASGPAVAAVERRLGRPLPPSYQAFLELYDGWPQFFHGASLFGVRPLLRGVYVDFSQSGLPGGELIPFGSDSRAETIFAWDPASERGDGELEVVVWINEIGERVPSFASFLDLVLEMHAAELGGRAAPQTRRRPVFDRRQIERAFEAEPFRAA